MVTLAVDIVMAKGARGERSELGVPEENEYPRLKLAETLMFPRGEHSLGLYTISERTFLCPQPAGGIDTPVRLVSALTL